MIKRLFFDLGSTLIDESECAEYRTRELLRQRAVQRGSGKAHGGACRAEPSAV